MLAEAGKEEISWSRRRRIAGKLVVVLRYLIIAASGVPLITYLYFSLRPQPFRPTHTHTGLAHSTGHSRPIHRKYLSSRAFISHRRHVFFSYFFHWRVRGWWRPDTEAQAQALEKNDSAGSQEQSSRQERRQIESLGDAPARVADDWNVV
jgi:hypothetical protein